MDDFRDLAVRILTAMAKPDSVVMSQCRHVLTALGAILLQHGYADSSTVNEIVGAGMVIAGDGWSIAVKYIITHWLQVATLVPSTTTRAQLADIVANMPDGAPTIAKVSVAIQAANDKGTL